MFSHEHAAVVDMAAKVRARTGCTPQVAVRAVVRRLRADDRATVVALSQRRTAADRWLELSAPDDGQWLDLARRAQRPYNWRHGWIPLNVATALRWRKKKIAEKLHRDGAPFADRDMQRRSLGNVKAAGPRDLSGPDLERRMQDAIRRDAFDELDRLGAEGDRRHAAETAEIAGLDDDALDGRMQDAIAREDYDLLERLGAEGDRREAERAKRNAAADADRIRRDREANERLDEMGKLIDEGIPEAEAWAAAYGKTADEFRRKEAIRALKAAGYKGDGFDALARDAFQHHVAGEFDRAETELNGYLLSKEAEQRNAAAGRSGVQIEARDLFEGNATTARKYASEELRRWWDVNGRPTFAEWRAELEGDPTAAARIRSRRDAMFA